MLSILKNIPNFSFSCQLDDFIILADIPVSVDIGTNGLSLFSSRYVPDAKNEIHFRDLADILENTLVSDGPLQQFEYCISAEGEDPISDTFIVLLCRQMVANDALSFVQSHFLTLMDKQKETFVKSTEYLYVTNGFIDAGENIAVNVTCYYVDYGRKLHTDRVAHGSALGKGVCKIDVSPTLFIRDDMTLVKYIVEVGQRSMTYIVSDGLPSAGVSFINNFGCIETYDFRGLVTSKPEFERNAVRINGIYTNISSSRIMHYICSLATIPESMILLADDIAASRDIILSLDNTRYPVTVVDSNTERNNSPSALTPISWEFVESGKPFTRVPVVAADGVFDNTFDKTFN